MTDNEALEVLKTHDGKCSGCDKLCDDLCKPAVETAIKALEEIQQYRTIGTVDEFREAKERMTKKRPIKYQQYKKHAEGICPNCGCGVMDLNDIENCTSCGQAIDWSDTD